MSWAYGIVNGREVGYSVEAECDHPECSEMIDRGVSYMCGSYGTKHEEDGCGLHFCEDHRDWRGLCAACAKCVPAIDEDEDE